MADVTQHCLPKITTKESLTDYKNTEKLYGIWLSISNTTPYVRNPQSSNSYRLEVAINKNLGFQSKFVCRHRVGNQQPNEFYLNIFVCAFPV